VIWGTIQGCSWIYLSIRIVFFFYVLKKKKTYVFCHMWKKEKVKGKQKEKREKKLIKDIPTTSAKSGVERQGRSHAPSQEVSCGYLLTGPKNFRTRVSLSERCFNPIYQIALNYSKRLHPLFNNLVNFLLLQHQFILKLLAGFSDTSSMLLHVEFSFKLIIFASHRFSHVDWVGCPDTRRSIIFIESPLH